MIDVCYASDDNYWRYMATSMLSAMLSARAGDELRFWILDNGLSSETKSTLEKLCAKWQCSIKFCPINFDKFKALPPGGAHISNTTYARYDIADLLPPSVEKVIYLDCDTLVQDSLKPLYEYDLDGYYLGGVTDVGYRCGRFDKNEEFDLNGFYINAGMLLINLKLWREKDLGARLLQYTVDNAATIKIGDQDVINSVCKGCMLSLSYRYNVQDSFFRFEPESYPDFADGPYVCDAAQHPAVIHYTFKYKPWNAFCMPKADVWLKVYVQLMTETGMVNDDLLALYNKWMSLRFTRLKLRTRRFLADIIRPKRRYAHAMTQMRKSREITERMKHE